jgi:pSer/pThr/pTyr-binding forkhead associated (FHA) protein
MVGSKVKLLIVQGRPTGKALSFPPGDYFIGRGPECHVRPNSEWVSRQHCRLRVTDENALLRDLGSRNGTLLNGVLLEHEECLHPGDQVQIGPLVFEVQIEESVPDTVREHAEATAESAMPSVDDTATETKSLAATQKHPPLSPP